jgi:hypothetical protein
MSLKWNERSWPFEPLPLWKRVPKWLGRIIMVLLPIAALVAIPLVIEAFDNEIQAPGYTFDFFGVYLPLVQIIWIFGVILGIYGIFGTIVGIMMVVKFLAKKPFKLTKTPKIAAFVMIGIVLFTANYYSPFWMINTGITKPTFGPYLAYYGETGMSISWETPKPQESVLYWGTDESDVNTRAEGGEAIDGNIGPSEHHIVILDHLAPGTTYYYRVPQLGNQIHEFRTAPSSSSGESVIFTIVADTQGGYDIQKRNIALMKADPEKPAFTSIIGDLVNRNDNMAEWNMLFDKKSYGGLVSSIPWMNAPGNHEGYSEDRSFPYRSNYKDFFQYDFPGNRTLEPGAKDFGMYYSYNYSNVHMIALDVFENNSYTESLGKTTGSFLTTAQLNWLEADLARNSDMWKFVYFHVPMYSMGDFGSNEDLCWQLEPIFAQYGVDAVFYGHDHHFEAYLVNQTAWHHGMYHFILGGGGGTIDPMTSTAYYGARAWPNTSMQVNASDGRFDSLYGHQYQLYGELTHHYMKVKVVGQTATFTAIRSLDGSIIQQYILQR